MFKKLFKSLFLVLIFLSCRNICALADDNGYSLIRGFSDSSKRIRTHRQFQYTFDTKSGFFCKPESVKGDIYRKLSSLTFGSFAADNGHDARNIVLPTYFYNRNTVETAVAIFEGFLGSNPVSAIFDLVTKMIAYAITGAEKEKKELQTSAVSGFLTYADLLLMPVMCTAIVASYAKLGFGFGTLIVLVLEFLNLLLGDFMYTFIGGDDYGVDIKNPACAAISTTMLASCVAYFIANRAFGAFDLKTLAVYGIAVAIYTSVKLIQGSIQEVRAIKAYDDLSICGDDWYTYGNPGLLGENGEGFKQILDTEAEEYKFPELVNTKNESRINQVNIPKITILDKDKLEYNKEKVYNLVETVYDFYPEKSTELPGAYKYFLDKCIEEINSSNNSTKEYKNDYCSHVGARVEEFRNKNGVLTISVNNRIYREQKYGGIEIMFETYNGSENFDKCYDPRPESANYDVYEKKQKVEDRRQLYYARGIDGINFACERWAGKEEYAEAFDCCVKASEKFICVNSHKKNNISKIGHNYSYDDLRKRHSNDTTINNFNQFCNIDSKKCEIKYVAANDGMLFTESDIKGTATTEELSKIRYYINSDIAINKLNIIKLFGESENFRVNLKDKPFKIEGEYNKYREALLLSVMQRSFSVISEKNEKDECKLENIDTITKQLKCDIKECYYNEKNVAQEIPVVAEKCTRYDILFNNNLSVLTITQFEEIAKQYSEIETTSGWKLFNNRFDENLENTIKSQKSQNISTISLKVYGSENDGDDKYCVKTQSFCPYDFNIGGGTEKVSNEFREVLAYKNKQYNMEGQDCIESANNKGTCTSDTGNNYVSCEIIERGSDKVVGYRECYNKNANYCQIDRHCQRITPYLVDAEPDLSNIYLDKSCINLVGSSKLNYLYEEYYSYYPMKNVFFGHFTAPIVECIVETAKNQLLNRAGRTICVDNSIPNDAPGVLRSKICKNGILYEKGEVLTNRDGVVNKIRKNLRGIINILLVLSLVFYGWKVVILNHETHIPELFKHLFKIVFVVSLSFSYDWINPLMSTIYGITNDVINYSIYISHVKALEPSYDNNDFDGCYFTSDPFFYNNKNAVWDTSIPKSKWTKYEKGREYIALFDMIDCKIRLYLGSSLNNSAFSIVMLCILVVFTGGAIIIILIPLIFIFVSVFILLMKIAYMVLVTLLTLTILLFFTPIFIPMILFDKTSGIFDTWVSKVLGYMFYSMFLVFGVTFVFFFIGMTIQNGAKFTGKQNAPFRDLYCGTTCTLDLGGEKTLLIRDDEAETCKMQGGTVKYLKDQSLMCFLNMPKVEQPKNAGLLEFFMPNINLRMLAPNTIKTVWTIMFGQGLVVMFAFLLVDQILNGITKLGENIFQVSVGADLIPNVADVMGKIVKFASSKLFDNPTGHLIGTGYEKLKGKVNRAAHAGQLGDQMKGQDKENEEEKRDVGVKVNDGEGGGDGNGTVAKLDTSEDGGGSKDGGDSKGGGEAGGPSAAIDTSETPVL